MELPEAKIEVEKYLAETYGHEVRKHLAKTCGHEELNIVIVEDKTIERRWGWIFFFYAEEFLKTRSAKQSLEGLGALVVDRQSGLVSRLPAYRDGPRQQSMEHRIKLYETRMRRFKLYEPCLSMRIEPAGWTPATFSCIECEISCSYDRELL